MKIKLIIISIIIVFTCFGLNSLGSSTKKTGLLHGYRIICIDGTKYLKGYNQLSPKFDPDTLQVERCSD